MLSELQLDCQRERARIVAFIRQVLANAGYYRVVVGVSGGIDSALTTVLCVEALGAENVRAMILPYETSNPDSEGHARMLIDSLGISFTRFEITDMVRPLIARYPDMSDRRKGNIMARCRMIALFDQSMLFHALVAGTSNCTELLLGYFTLHGDGAASFEPIGHLYKCQVRALARHLGVPEPILAKAPSADLWKGQTDEGELGFTYDEADQILYLATECGLTVEEMVARGFEGQTVGAIVGHMEATAFKRCMPPMLRVERRSQSGVGGFRRKHRANGDRDA